MRSGYPDPGEMLGNFRLGRRLGLGGMGIVFEALDTQLNRRLALKVISPHLADDEAFRARFRREAQAQASLDSPHVVQVYSHGEIDGHLYIATQLVPDGDLGAMIQAHGAPPVRLALDVIAQVADGLADAHAAGLIHRDIKPANVLLRRRGAGLSAYLADFGIARQVDASSLTTAGETIGTPTYMAPELHTGGSAGVTSDVYSLGCLLWAALSGRAPYAGTSDFQIVTAHFEQPIPQLEETSELARETNRVLRTAMAKEPEGRYPGVGLMRADLRAALELPEGPPVEPRAEALSGGPPPPLTRQPALSPAPSNPSPPAPTPLRPTPTPKVGRRRRMALVVGLAVLVVSGAGLTVALSRDDSPAGGDDTASPPGGDVEDSDEAQAVSSLSEAFAAQPGADAPCIAEALVTDVGLPALLDAGFFDEEWTFLDPDLSDEPEIKDALSRATFTCA